MPSPISVYPSAANNETSKLVAIDICASAEGSKRNECADGLLQRGRSGGGNWDYGYLNGVMCQCGNRVKDLRSLASAVAVLASAVAVLRHAKGRFELLGLHGAVEDSA